MTATFFNVCMLIYAVQLKSYNFNFQLQNQRWAKVNHHKCNTAKLKFNSVEKGCLLFCFEADKEIKTENINTQILSIFCNIR